MLSKPSAIEWRTSLTVTSSSRSTKHLPRSAPATAGGTATRGPSTLGRFAGSPFASRFARQRAGRLGIVTGHIAGDVHMRWQLGEREMPRSGS